MFTVVLSTAGLWLTVVPVAIANGPNVASVGSGFIAFCRQLEPQATAYQDVLLAVLTAIFIVRVIHRGSDGTLADTAGPWAVVFVHALAALIVNIGVLAVVGAATGNTTAASGGTWSSRSSRSCSRGPSTPA
jgi:hypothetical protein